MTIKIPNEGELELLDKAIHDVLSVNENFILKLYKNNYTPVDASTATDFTVADFTNYVDKTLHRANFSAATTVGGKASTTYDTAQSWTCGTTGNTIYGYYVVGNNSGKVCWAEKFDTARILNSGDIFSITPSLTLRTES